MSYEPKTTDATINTSDITTNDVSSTKHGFAPKSPADATKFLNGAAIPGYAQVKDSDLSTTDITTNDVSTSKHGFAPKGIAGTTQFWGQDWVLRTPIGASYKNGVATRAGNAVSGTQTIAHGLGKTPTKVKITAIHEPSSTVVGKFAQSFGTFDGTNTNTIYITTEADVSQNTTSGNDTVNIINLIHVVAGGNGIQVATIAIDATNITLTWTATGGGLSVDNIQMLWEVSG